MIKKNNNEEIKHFNLRVDENMKACIEEEAQKEGISQNQFIINALGLYLCHKVINTTHI